MDELFNTDTYGTDWGDNTPVAPDNTDYGYTPSTDTGVYPDGSGGYTDINGNQVDSTGQPITYGTNGDQYDSNGNIINKATPYQMTPTDQTITPGGYDANGNPLDVNGNPMQPGQQQPGQQQPGQQQPGQQPRQQPGVNNQNGNGGGNNQNGSGSSFSDMLGTLGGLALVGGVGALLSHYLGGKAVDNAAQVNPVNIPTGNYTPGAKLNTPTTNPGSQMGQPVAPVQPMTSNLTAGPNLSAIPTINPQTLTANG